MVLPLTTSSTNLVKLTLSTILNPVSLATPTAISVYLYVGGYLSLASNVVVGPFTPNLITYSVSQTSQIMAEATNIQMTITSTNNIPPIRYLAVAGYLAITVPVEYTTTGLGCGPITGIAGASCSVSSGVVKVTGTSYSTAITIDLTGLVNPSQSNSSIFSVSSYDSLHNAVDTSSTNYQYSLACTLPCRTCTTILATCLTCYTLSTLQSIVSNRQYFTLSTCVTSCNISSYADSNLICIACSSLCSTCSVSATNCMSCPSTLSHLLNNTCYSSCPSGYYNDSSSTCSLCINNCDTCTTATICLTCKSGFVMNIT